MFSHTASFRVKGEPRHVDLLTPLGNPAPALFEQPATIRPSTVLCGYWPGWPLSFPNAVPPAPRPLSTPHPSKKDSDALEERTAAHPAPAQGGVVTQGKWITSSLSPPTLCGHPRLCRHPGQCGAISTLWGPVLTGRRDTSCCAARAPSSARPSNRCTDDDQTWAPAGPPSKSPLDRHRSHHDACRDHDSPGQPSNHKYYIPVPRHYT
jgi:hypothetical protein